MGSLETRTREKREKTDVNSAFMYTPGGSLLVRVSSEARRRRRTREGAAAGVARAIQAGKNLAAATEQREAIKASAEPHEEAMPRIDQQSHDGGIPAQPTQASQEATQPPA